MKYLFTLTAVTFLAILSCKKKADTPAATLDAPAYNFFPGTAAGTALGSTVTNSNNVAILAYSAAGIPMLLKTTPSGSQLLNKEINIPASTLYGSPSIYSIASTADGYLVCGSAGVTGTYMGSAISSSDVFLAKLNSNGDVLWTKLYGGDKEDYGKMMIATRDGNFLLCGITYSYTTEPYDDIYLIKVNKDGDTLWTHAYPKHEQQTPFHVLEASNGDFVVVGTDEPSGSSRVRYILRVSANGSKIGDDNSGAGGRWAFCAAECPNGELMVCGIAGSKILLQRANTTGTVIWEKTFALSDSNGCTPTCIKSRPDDTYTIIGGEGNLYVANGNTVLLKVDKSGNQQFFKRIPATGTTTGASFHIINGDNILIGNQQVDQKTNNIFITRTDANGNYK